MWMDEWLAEKAEEGLEEPESKKADLEASMIDLSVQSWRQNKIYVKETGLFYFHIRIKSSSQTPRFPTPTDAFLDE